MQQACPLSDTDRRKMRFLYHSSGIVTRHSVIPDYGQPLSEWTFYPRTADLRPFPSLEARMEWFNRYAVPLSADAVRRSIDGHIRVDQITHLITVSCTGLSAPGLDLLLMDELDLPNDIFRTSVNFMGCYAAIHAMKMGDMICRTDKDARVLIVCTELCTLHFQQGTSIDEMSSGLLFADGSAALLMVPDGYGGQGLQLKGFYGEVVPRGKKDMAWELSSTGFLMTLSGYVPGLIGEDIGSLVDRALKKNDSSRQQVSHWCVHPGGKKILEAVGKNLQLNDADLSFSQKILQEYGNMSSPTILFVLEKIMKQIHGRAEGDIFGLAFGPGLTMETFLATPVAE